MSSPNLQDETGLPATGEPKKTYSLRTFFKAFRHIFFVVSVSTTVYLAFIGFVLVEVFNVTSKEHEITPGDTYSTPGANLSFLILVICVTVIGVVQHKKKSKTKSS